VEQLTIGPHLVEIDDDLFFVHWRGDPEFAPLAQVYDRLGQFIAERGYALVLFDLRQAGVPSGAIRRWVGQWWRQKRPGSVIVASYGMGEPLRSMMVLINRALTLFQGASSPLTELFSTEAEARKWLAGHRPQLVARAAARQSAR
jgi:hypothetical protein